MHGNSDIFAFCHAFRMLTKLTEHATHLLFLHARKNCTFAASVDRILMRARTHTKPLNVYNLIRRLFFCSMLYASFTTMKTQQQKNYGTFGYMTTFMNDRFYLDAIEFHMDRPKCVPPLLLSA